MGVEICEAEAVHLNSTTERFASGIGISFEQAYNEPILGTSIGPAGDASTSGSLGFYVKIERQGNMQVFAVTCHHVVAPGLYILLVCLFLPGFINQPRILGVEIAVDAEKSPIQVESPSQADHDTWTAKLAQVPGFSADMKDLCTSMGVSVPDKGSNDTRLQTALAFSRHLGSVRGVTSGMTEKSQLHYDCRLDWALIELGFALSHRP